MEAVELLLLVDGHHLHDVAVGDEADFGVFIEPVVVVLDGHEIVAGGDAVFAVEDALPDFAVEEVCAFVGAGDGDDVVACVVAVEVKEQVLEFAALDAGEVVKGLAAEEGEGNVLAADLVAELGGVEEDAGVVGLPHHVGESSAVYLDVEGGLQVVGG